MSVGVQPKPALDAPAAAAGYGRSRRRRLARAALANPTFLSGMLIFLIVATLAVGAPWIAPHDPLDMVGDALLWPGQDPGFILGTDSLGRDITSGLVYGARVSLLIGVSAAIIGLAIGILVGAVTGYFGGRIDAVGLRLMELFQTVPSFLLVIVIVVIGAPSIGMIALASGLASWPIIARLVRAEFRSIRGAEFVLSAKVLGSRPYKIIFSEILPNVMAPVVVTISVLVANAILIEAALSFLGLGDPSVVSWGSMIRDGRLLLRSNWYLSAIPGLAITLTVLSLNLAGDGLNDLLNPRTGSA